MAGSGGIISSGGGYVQGAEQDKEDVRAGVIAYRIAAHAEEAALAAGLREKAEELREAGAEIYR